MDRKTASDYYHAYRKIQGDLSHLEGKIEERLTFLLNKYKDENPTVLVNGWDERTIQELIEFKPVQRYGVDDMISIIDAIEKWIESQQTFVQLKIFK